MNIEQQLVKARSHRVLVEELNDEIVVYDLNTDRAHLLSPNVARVWRAADGSRSVSELFAYVEAATPEQASVIVWEALHQLESTSLLDGSVVFPGQRQGMTRRAMLKRVAIAAAAIPVITTIVSPTPAAALTCAGPCHQTNNPCQGETTVGGCRCSSGGTGTCGPCQPAGTVTACRICCSLTCVGGATTGNGVCAP